MDLATLRGIRSELDLFLGRFDGCFRRRESREYFGVYVRGQLGPLERKSVEPIALEAGVHPRNLQQFLGQYAWDEKAMARRTREVVRDEHFCAEAIGVIDDTSVAKKGTKTVGIQRQYCGSTGKVDNCVVTVHVNYVAPDISTIVDSDLYLPQSWFDDPSRCEVAGVPAGLAFRTKPQIALDLLDRTRADGVPLKWITADEGYGEVPTFLDGVAARGLLYVIEVPGAHVHGWTPNGLRVGRKKSPLKDLWWRGGPTWTTYAIKDTTRGDVVWDVRSTVFVPSWDPTKRLRLLVAQNVLTEEIKYFLSNAPLETPVTSLLTVAFTRWNVERCFEDAKGEVGFDHFEVRGYRSVQRHLTISMLSLLFLSRVSRRLRGEKGGALELLSGEAGDRRAARSDAFSTSAG
jgi:SRSO17 transposase